MHMYRRIGRVFSNDNDSDHDYLKFKFNLLNDNVPMPIGFTKFQNHLFFNLSKV